MDDAAHVHMGGKWRMPSEEQLEELINNTTHDVVKMNGIKGMLFTSDMNEHQLFILFMYASWYDRNWENYYGNYADIWCNKVHISIALVDYIVIHVVMQIFAVTIVITHFQYEGYL